MFDAAAALRRLQQSPPTLEVTELGDTIRDCVRLQAWASARLALLVTEFDRAKAYLADGAVDAAGWLNKHTGATKANAHTEVRTATHLAQMDHTRHALEDGLIGVHHAARMVKAHMAETGHRLDAAADTKLLDTAAHQTPERFCKTVTAWERAVAEDSGGSAAERMHQKRSVWLCDHSPRGKQAGKRAFSGAEFAQIPHRPCAKFPMINICFLCDTSPGRFVSHGIPGARNG